MSETAKRNAMRGGPAKEPKTSEAVEETPSAPKVATKSDLPPGVEELPDGEWVYSLQYEPRMIPKVKGDGTISEEKDLICLPFKVRIPSKVWAKNVRQASQAEHQGEVLFYLCCSMTHLSASVMDRFDARDFGVIQARVQAVLDGSAVKAGNG